MIEHLKSKATRRTVIGAIGVGAGLASIGAKTANASDGFTYSHGIASGDPTQNQVILWTRVLDTSNLGKNITGTWQVSSSADFTSQAAEGTFKTGPKRDFTVKVDAIGLQPDTAYFYRFLVGDIQSPVGKTKTLPAGDDAVDLAVVSCSNYSHGHFHVYKEIAERDYQAVLHLGDYIYEYAEGKYDNAAVLEQGRTSKPKTEIISLEDYRKRYAHYRSDPDLLAAHARHPFICVWDDHEVANDTWKGGAENHNEGEGDFKERQTAAIRAYYEWLPIRESKATSEGKIYRTFELGNLASLIMMDTRHIGRDRGLLYQSDLPMRTIPFDFSNPDAPAAILTKAAMKAANPEAIKQITVPFLLSKESATPMTDWAQIKELDPKALPKGYTYLPDTERFEREILGDEKRTILGAEQEAWLTAELAASKAKGKPWQILGQQLLAGKLGIPQIPDSAFDYEKSKILSPQVMAFFRMLGQMGMPFNLDAWDGYPACRERVYDAIRSNANNAVFLAGDTHNAWAFDLADKQGAAIGVELGTPGISSPGMESFIPVAPETVRTELFKVSPELKYANTTDRGWMSLNISLEKVTAQWHFVSSVISPTYTTTEGHSLSVAAGAHKIAGP